MLAFHCLTAAAAARASRMGGTQRGLPHFLCFSSPPVLAFPVTEVCAVKKRRENQQGFWREAFAFVPARKCDPNCCRILLHISDRTKKEPPSVLARRPLKTKKAATARPTATQQFPIYMYTVRKKEGFLIGTDSPARTNKKKLTHCGGRIERRREE